ncbi:MAG: transcriptional repressor LexA [Tenericutes bacterium]|nr:transcriptional repressor LexA [Mycoplasmatota bacterium]
MEKLTDRQEEILQIIKQLIAKNGYPPTVREIGAKAKLNSPATIHFHLKKLEEKGYIRKGSGKNRTIEILVPNEYLEQNENVVEVPLLGKVTAGSPIEAIETPDEYFALPAYLVNSKKEIFTLKVSGESMINVGIYDGDILIVERKNTANNGDTVVAMNSDNEVTVKTFYKENGYFRLQPENDTMEPIILKEVTILGKAIGLYRKL